MRYLIVAAKTGGHVFPAATISSELISNNNEIILLGTGNDIEKNAYKNLDSKFYKLSIEGFRGGSVLHKLKVIYQAFKNIFIVIKIVKKNKIDAMIGFGGFITVPAGIACWIKKIPVFIHEQNSVMGSANKLLSNIAKKTFLGFPIKKLEKSIISGNPIRKSFLINLETVNNNDRDEIRIYVTGGSQGAEFINQEIPKAINKLSGKLKIKHQCGQGNQEEVAKLYNSFSINAEVLDFYENPASQILWSDFVICRAGALSLSETISCRRGGIIVPLPTSIDNHQVENAKCIQKMKMGVLHEEKDGRNDLIDKLKKVIERKLFSDWKKFNVNDHVNASKIILEHLESYFKT
tara:strand:+ start:823 stop:1869 length:1047 start_codon:yes stop_codon:yes gene_type:complete